MGTLKNETTRTQLREIRKHLEQYGRNNDDIAYVICGTKRLPARIYDLKHDPVDPMNIKTVTVTRKNRFGHTTNGAEYLLVKEEETA